MLVEKNQLDEDKPEFTDLYIKEFYELSQTRQSGFGVGPITYVEILAYLLLGLSEIPDPPEIYVMIMSQLDRAYRKYHHDEHEKEMKRNQEKSKTSKPMPRRMPHKRR